MGINFHKIKKWTNMMLGKSSYHVNQNEGKVYSKIDIKGYYNNLTEKVSRFGLSGDTIPKTIVDSGETIYFPIAIFQYGLAAYDLLLLKQGDEADLKSKIIACANWAVENQQEDGSWITFAYESPDNPYSSMSQGEAISLLIRSYYLNNDERYINCAKKAFDFMIIPIEDGGTAKYDGENIYFYECPAEPLILNGWIFSIWGVYDYYKFFKDSFSRTILVKTLNTLEKKLPEFDLGYWSKYEDGKRICSPFYHRLHISQLNVMFKLFDKETYIYYAKRWSQYEDNNCYRIIAFSKKAIQKILE